MTRQQDSPFPRTRVEQAIYRTEFNINVHNPYTLFKKCQTNKKRNDGYKYTQWLLKTNLLPGPMEITFGVTKMTPGDSRKLFRILMHF